MAKAEGDFDPAEHPRLSDGTLAPKAAPPIDDTEVGNEAYEPAAWEEIEGHSVEHDSDASQDPEQLFANLKTMVDEGDIPLIPSKLEHYLKELGLWTSDEVGQKLMRRLGSDHEAVAGVEGPRHDEGAHSERRVSPVRAGWSLLVADEAPFTSRSPTYPCQRSSKPTAPPVTRSRPSSRPGRRPCGRKGRWSRCR